jgi:hypothetical protein
MLGHRNLSNFSIINGYSFVIAGMLSIFYCIEKVYNGGIILIDFSDYAFLFVILLMGICLINLGILQMQMILKGLEKTSENNNRTPIIHNLLKLFWYANEYDRRRNEDTQINGIKHYLGTLIIVIAIFCIGFVFFYWNQSILFEIIIKISILINIIIYARKYLM